MKRWTLLTLATTAVIAAAVAGNGLAGSAAAGPSATGSGHRTTAQTEPGGIDYRTFSFAAQQHRDGSVTGQAQVNNRAQDLKQHIEIDCLKVIGNRASIGGVITRSTQGFEGMRANFFVEDNGEGSGGNPDKISNIFRNGEGLPNDNTDCRAVFVQPVRTVEHGNVQVRG